MTKEEIRMIGIFIAGRVAKVEKTYGASDVTKETVNQKNERIITATSEFLRWMYNTQPDMLPEEFQHMVEGALLDTKLGGYKNIN